MEEQQKSQVKTRRILIVTAAILAVLLVAFVLWRALDKPETARGTKTITVTVVDKTGESEVFKIQTDAAFLREALEQEDLIAGEDSETGLYVKTVNGITADDANQEWWCFTKGGEALMTGVDETPIADGDVFEITLTVGW